MERLVRLTAMIAPLLLVATACGGEEEVAASYVAADVARQSPDPGAAEPVAEASAAFAVDVYHELAAAGDGNLVFSPHSIAVALGMTRVGARGDTAVAMDAVLHAESVPDLHAGNNALDQILASRAGEQTRDDGSTAELELVVANALWGQSGYEFLDEFLVPLAEDYGAGVRLVDYESDAEGARVQINDWVADQTENRIEDLIPAGALNSLTRLVLTNAVYLLAPWEHPFAEVGTEPGPFSLLDGGSVDAQLMTLTAPLGYARFDDHSVVQLPYAGGELALLVVVPDEGSFATVETGLSAAGLAEMVDALEGREIRLRFPRFEFRTQAGLAPVLRTLGMGVAFDPATADFSGMTTEESLFVSDVVHEAFIAVDEEGTEAAAATAVVMAATSMPAEPIELTVDRPFVFALHDVETGAILFLGRVTDPTA